MAKLKKIFQVTGLIILAITLIFVIPSVIVGIDYGPFDLLDWSEIKRNALLYLLYYLILSAAAVVARFYYQKKKWSRYLAIILILGFPCISTEYYYFCYDGGDRFDIPQRIEEEDNFVLRYNVLSNYLMSSMAVFKTPGSCRMETLLNMKIPKISGESYRLNAVMRYVDSTVYFRNFGCVFVLSVFFFLCYLCNRYFLKKQRLIEFESEISQNTKQSDPEQ